MLYYDGLYNWEDYIKHVITPFSVFTYYIGSSFDLGKVFNSPLRKDDNPSFSIFSGKEELLYKDFATGESGNCIKFVQNMFGISKAKAIIKILASLYDYKPITDKTATNHLSKKHESSSIDLKTIDFTKEDLSYWNKYYITKETLDKFKTFNTQCVWINSNIVWEKTKKEPIYTYIIDNKIKIYRPKSNKSAKWAGNTTQENIFGLQQLPDKGELLIITKSGKDVMVLYELGYNSISPNSETSLIPENIIDNLKTRFNKIIVLMDNDTAGKKAGNKYNSIYNLKDVYLDSDQKDISDYIEKHGIDDTKKVIKSLLRK
ncbi:MAG: toprim domain-containing protein [Methanogenium sp.]|jgi:DNA primase